jgi:hypothetical protein
LTGTVEKPLLFYLYGTIVDPDSLVLSEDDFLDFIVATIVKNPLPDNILGQIRLPNKNLLFLGFDFRQWYLRILTRILEIKSKSSPSFALEQFTPHNPEEFKQTIFFYRESDYRIHICNQELPGFVKALKTKYAELSARYEKRSPTESPSIPLQNAATVFLCHSKQNRDMAEYLRDEFRKAGFNAWFDEDDLCGGDEWDRKIEKAIAKEIDYFMVLQSQVMSTKLESYTDSLFKCTLYQFSKKYTIHGGEKIVKARQRLKCCVREIV